MQNTELPPYDAFHSKLRSYNPLETEYTDYVNLLKSGLTLEQAVIKLKLSKPPPTGIEKYHYLQQIWKQEQMSSFKDFFRWYNNKDIMPSLEAVQKMIAFYHDKKFDTLKLGCTLPNLGNINRFSVVGFCSHCITVLEAMGCFYHFRPCQELRPSLTEEDIRRGSRKSELDDLRRDYIQEKGFTGIEMWESESWRHYKTTTSVKLHTRENFPCRRSLTEHQFLEGIKKRNLFGNLQCNIEVPKKLRELEKFRRVLNEKANVTSNNRGFRTINYSVATYEQVIKVCPTFTQNE